MAAAFLLKPKPIAPEAIRASVVRTPALIECAWQLPVAVTYQRELASQSNGSLCGPASLANAFRSLGEAATREDEVLAGTGKCWTGICVMGLTLDQLAGVARKHTQRAVTVLRDLTRERFRAELRRSNDPRLRYLINFAASRSSVPVQVTTPRSPATSSPKTSSSCSTSTATSAPG